MTTIIDNKQNYFIYNNNKYNYHTDGLAIGSYISAIQSKISLQELENKTVCGMSDTHNTNMHVVNMHVV